VPPEKRRGEREKEREAHVDNGVTKGNRLGPPSGPRVGKKKNGKKGDEKVKCMGHTTSGTTLILAFVLSWGREEERKERMIKK